MKYISLIDFTVLNYSLYWLGLAHSHQLAQSLLAVQVRTSS